MSPTASFLLTHQPVIETEVHNAEDQSRDLYPDVYKTDVFVEVAEEILAVIRNSRQTDASYERREVPAQGSLFSGPEGLALKMMRLHGRLPWRNSLEQKQLREE